MNHIYDTVIIGGGPAGYTAALYCARAGLDTLIIEKLTIGGQMSLTGEIENYPGFNNGIDGITLGANMQAGAEKFGAKTEYAQVSSLNLTSTPKEIVTDGKTYLAKTVIIATGADPRPLGLEKEKDLIGRGVHYCAHCDGRFYKDKTVAVIGGGNSAVSDALYLSRLAKKVYLIHRRDTLRATKIYHETLTKTENVKFIKSSTIADITVDKRITGIILQSTLDGTQTSLDCNGIFVSIGRDPTTKLVDGILPLDGNGYIIADETTKTAIDGVFAVGDVRTKVLRQIVTATADGAVAAHFAEEYISQL